MQKEIDLQSYLSTLVAQGNASSELESIVDALGRSAIKISKLIARGEAGGGLAKCVKADNGTGDSQKRLDVLAHNYVVDALQGLPVAWLASEECEESIEITPGASLSVAIDPLDGSSNIETNAPIGTIFSILPTASDATSDSTFFQPGAKQVAAGFFVYGPQCALFLTCGCGTDVFILDPDSGLFVLNSKGAKIARNASEFAINCSNARHWSLAVRHYVDDCAAGKNGPIGRDFNMRWIASLVAEAQRIVVRGGVYLYPSDERNGYENGRLRLIYEANPIALLVEQAGGLATDGSARILDVKPTRLHQRTPFVFGSCGDVELVRYYTRGPHSRERSPALFSQRDIFRH